MVVSASIDYDKILRKRSSKTTEETFTRNLYESWALARGNKDLYNCDCAGHNCGDKADKIVIAIIHRYMDSGGNCDGVRLVPLCNHCAASGKIIDIEETNITRTPDAI